MNRNIWLIIIIILLLLIFIYFQHYKYRENFKTNILDIKGISKKKCAICYFGMTRSTRYVYKSHYDYIFNVLEKYNISFDIYLHTWKTKNQLQRIWEKEIPIRIVDDEYKLLKPNKYKIDFQETYLDRIDFNKYFYKDVYDTIGHNIKGEWLPRLVKNHICALESQKRVLQLVTSSNTRYDYIMFVRPDVLIETKIPIKTVVSKLDTVPNAIIIPNFAHNEGYNDRFAIMNYKYANLYANRGDNIISYRKKHGRIVSEKYTKFICDQYFKPFFIKFNFNIIRPK